MLYLILPGISTMHTTVINETQNRYTIRVINSIGAYSLLSMLFLATVLTLLFIFDKTIVSILLLSGFGIYGLYSLNLKNYTGWFSVICFFCGAESLIRNGLPAAYIFLFYYLVVSGVLFLFSHTSNQRFKLTSATGLFFLLAILHFINLDLQELRFGIGKWGVIWMGLFFGMWISQSVQLNIKFYECIWFYMVGATTVLFSFLIAPQYFGGRYWPTFDGTGPVATIIGILVLVLLQLINPKRLLTFKNLLLGGLLLACVIALVMLGSRGTFLGLAVASVFFLFTFQGLWSKVLIFLAIICAIGLVYYVDQSPIGNKVLSSRVEEATEEDTREGRKFINSAVMLAFAEDPVFGKGTGSWRHYNNKYIAAVFDRRYSKDLMMTDAHNTVLQLLFEHGILGAGIFLTAFFLLIKRSYSLSKYTGIFLFPLILFSFTIGLTTMHKQGAMFLPFFLCVMILYSKHIVKKNLS
jgi:O-antigen ligase